MDGPPRSRVVLVGASNLTRGFLHLCDLAGSRGPEPVAVLGAFGHGRSYGLTSSVLGRELPAILACGLWPALTAAPRVPMRALVTDVGNDVMYGARAPAILGWVEETLRRLRAVGAEIVLTSLPPPVHAISRFRFRVFRRLLFRSRGVRYEAVREAVPALDAGLRALADRYGARFAELRAEWYGIDPIHIGRRHRAAAWSELWGSPAAASPPRVSEPWPTLAVYRLLPEQQRLFGHDMRTPQPCQRFRNGSTISLF